MNLKTPLPICLIVAQVPRTLSAEPNVLSVLPIVPLGGLTTLIIFVNLIYDSETKLTGTMLRPQPFSTVNPVNLISVDPMLGKILNA